MKSITQLLLILVAATLLLGCSTDDDSTNSSSDVATVADEEKAVKRVVTDLFAAYVDGDGKRACEMQTDAYTDLQIKEAASEEGFEIDAENCRDLVEKSAPLIRKFFESDSLTVTDASVDGNTATVNVAVTTSFGPSESVYALVKQDDRWLVNEERDVDEEPEVSSSTIRDWASKWCSVTAGMTRNEVESIMGEPSSEFDGSGGEAPQISYEGFGYSFGVFFDVDGEVKQLDFSPGDDKIGIDCESTRK